MESKRLPGRMEKDITYNNMRTLLIIFISLISSAVLAQSGSYRSFEIDANKLRSRNLIGLTDRLAIIKPNGEINFVANGTDGQIMTIVNNSPIFANPVSTTNIATQQFTGGNISHNAYNGINSLVVLTSTCSIYTLSNVKDGEQGDILVFQNSIGGYGINSIVQSGLTTVYPDINNDDVGDPPNAANINSGANRKSTISFHRVNNYLLVTYGNYAY